MAKKKKRVARKKINKNLDSFEAWFRKRAGKSEDSWGFIPINWKGWTALVLLAGINVFAANYFNLNELVFDNWSKFGIVFLLSIFVFIMVARRKTLDTKIRK